MPINSLGVGETARVTARMHDADGSVIENVFYWKNNGPLPEPANDLVLLLSGVLDDAYQLLIPQQAAALVYDDILFYNMDLGLPLGSCDWPTCDQGDNITYEMMPSGTAALIIGDTLYSRSRPKKFISGIHENHVLRNTITSSALLTALADFAIEWLATRADLITGNYLFPGCWHWITEHEGEFRRLYSAIVQDLVSYQRRRKPGVGQ
jgi:hypothetical protein